MIGPYHEFIDLSHHNTVRNYDALDPRFEAIIVRVSDGAMVDRRCEQHFDGAVDTGRKVGVYHRVSPYVRASEQIRTFREALLKVKFGDRGNILPVLDLEDNLKPTQEQRADFSAGGYRSTVEQMANVCDFELGGCIIYIGKAFAARIQYTIGSYPLWTPWYPSTKPVEPGWMTTDRLDKLKTNTNLLPNWRAWQYGQQRMPSFAAGPIDVNVVDTWEGLTL